MTTATQTLATTNEAWGFWCAMNEHASAAWPIASSAIANATRCKPEQVRAFLDSRYGHLFANDVQAALLVGCDLKDAIDQTTAKWMRQKMRAQSAKQYGVPRNTAYLNWIVELAALDEVRFA